MINRCVNPFTQPVFTESFGVKLIAQVAIYIIKNHEKEKKQEMKFMDRDCKNKYYKYSGFQNCFERMKSIRGKRTRIDGPVMGHMN